MNYCSRFDKYTSQSASKQASGWLACKQVYKCTIATAVSIYYFVFVYVHKSYENRYVYRAYSLGQGRQFHWRNDDFEAKVCYTPFCVC